MINYKLVLCIDGKWRLIRIEEDKETNLGVVEKSANQKTLTNNRK